MKFLGIFVFIHPMNSVLLFTQSIVRTLPFQVLGGILLFLFLLYILLVLMMLIQDLQSDMKKILAFLNKNWKVISTSIAAILAALLALFSLSSCGSTVKALVTQPKDTAHTVITITTNNPTSVTPTVDPNVTITPNK